MQIRILRNIGRATHPDFPPYHEGEVVESPKAEAEALIRAGLAEEVESVRAVTPPSEQLKGVPGKEKKQ